MTQDLSRRQLLKTSAGALPLLAHVARSASPRTLAYVGSYSSPQGPEGSKGNGKGVYVFAVDLATGSLALQQLCEDGMNPSWLALHPSARYLYAANEVSNFNDRPTGGVTAYGIDADSGNLRRLNSESSPPGFQRSTVEEIQ
jgi:6-phosphogluconolactonase